MVMMCLRWIGDGRYLVFLYCHVKSGSGDLTHRVKLTALVENGKLVDWVAHNLMDEDVIGSLVHER